MHAAPPYAGAVTMKTMATRVPRLVLLATVVLAYWVDHRLIVPWMARATDSRAIRDPDLAVVLDHWVFDQLSRVLILVAIWLVAARLELMPSFERSFRSGGSWRRVLRTGLLSSAVILLAIVAVGAAFGHFGFHPYFPKMAGDLVSNMYEEIVYRGVILMRVWELAASANSRVLRTPRPRRCRAARCG